MIDLRLHERSKDELHKLRDQVKISTLPYHEKRRLILDIELHMEDVSLAKNKATLREIQEGMADISDING